ncbi:hypothetical protein IEO21_03910 [Rhodonia placenta]|uniref:AFG1-like ATPase-domain-containing protein n=1 Tax=Rhodonia placenta TaxID=104341 RepID=A0A8H7U3G8_9APHY|nr:hypothetical protein IEO21_03910 [Postia placenta]
MIRAVSANPLAVTARAIDTARIRALRLRGTTIRASSDWHQNHGVSSFDDKPQDSQLPQQIDLLERYRGLCSSGKIRYDEEQIRVIMQLRRLQRELDGYAPPALSTQYLDPRESKGNDDSKPWWLHESHPEESAAEDHRALGLLLTGPPGSGKSFLIDLWYSAIPTPFKARKHYNEIVLEIYRAVWEETRQRMAATHSTRSVASDSPSLSWNKSIRERWRALLRSGSLPLRWTRQANGRISFGGTVQPTIAFAVAQRLILRHWLLVFDEVQLLDVSSATLLADVLSWFWRMGGVIVGSSNKVPDDLYKNGVQRERLEPFVEALKARCPVYIMRSEHDWRATRATMTKVKTWYVNGQEREFDTKVRAFADVECSPRSMQVIVFGRSLRVPWAIGSVCKFSFAELCDESLGPADYITLASTFRTVAITSIPILRMSAKNQARRFISLIDALYEARCRIVCLAEAKPEQLFFPDAPSATEEEAYHEQQSSDVDVMMAEAVAETQDVYRPNVSSYDAPNMAEAPKAPSSPLALDMLSIFSGKDEQFAFKRALSRLLEMTSDSYAEQEQWAPLPPSSRKWEAPSPQSQADQRPDQRPLQWAPSLRPADLETADSVHGATRESSASADSEGRPEAPRLSPAHVWGVREDWGDRAKDWGRGASAYENPSSTPARGGHRRE